VLPSALSALGLPARNGQSPAIAVPATDRVVVLLVDGLGAEQLDEHADLTPFLAARAASSRTLDAGFPSTTPISLTSLGVGAPPGRHGITGLVLALPETQRLVNTIAPPADLDLVALQPEQTELERAAAAGVEVTHTGPRSFAGVGISVFGLRGGRFSGSDTVGERVAVVHDAVRRGERSLVYAYWGDLDKTGHIHGVDSVAWRAELRHVDQLVEAVAATLPAGAVLLVTSDHGMLDLDPAEVTELADRPELDRDVRLYSGDPRAINLFAAPGRADAVRSAWRDTLGDSAWVLHRDEAVAAGWYGPDVPPAHLARLGDVVVAMRGRGAVVDSRVLPPVVRSFVGSHGSLTTAEQRIPLVVVP
jgi:hypothetical protein